MSDCFLIGKTLTYSFSREIHDSFGAYSYDLKELSEKELPKFISRKEFLGLNVTVPYKRTVSGLVDVLSDIAKRTGAVNTVVNKDGVLYGYNTDYFGFSRLLKTNDVSLTDKRILVLGDGGAAATVKAVAEDSRAKCVTLTSHKQIEKGLCAEADILINCTPVGMFPNIGNSPVVLDNISGLSAVIDLVYNPMKTRLLIQAERSKIKCVNGLSMLVAQAAKACELFKGKNIDNDTIDTLTRDIASKNRNIVLIGMGGAGKTVIAKELAKLLNRDVIDTDSEVERITDVSVSSLISHVGESEFRRIESVVVSGLSACRGKVISTGGGVVLDEKNVDVLKSSGVLIFIDCPPDKLQCEGRLLYLMKAMSEKVLNDRRQIYEGSADIIFHNDHTKSVEASAKELLDEIACY